MSVSQLCSFLHAFRKSFNQAASILCTSICHRYTTFGMVSIFGAIITKLDYIGGNDGEIVSEPLAADQANVTTPLEKVVRRSRRKQQQPLPQLPLFELDPQMPREADYEAAIQEVLKVVGPMPKGMKLVNSAYSIRILWALEIGFQAGLGPLRASDIARLICEYGNESVSASSVAHFFKNQRPSGEHMHLWKEEPKRYYTINAIGRRMFASLIGVRPKQHDEEGTPMV